MARRAQSTGGGRRALPTAIALCACAGILATVGPAIAARGRRASVPAGGQVRLRARLRPQRLGRPAAIRAGFSIADPPGQPLSPLAGMRLLLPAGMSIGASELGLASCTQTLLEEEGPSGCPVNSVIGRGSATAMVPFGSERVFEHVKVAIFSAPLQLGTPQLLVSATGEHPVVANIVFTGAVLEAHRPFGGVIETSMPPVPGLPGGPDVALTSMRIAIGPRRLTYTETVHGKTVRFHPAGVVLPRSCPHGGFPFAVQLRFMDGSTAQARTAVRCPAHRTHRRRSGHHARGGHGDGRRAGRRA